MKSKIDEALEIIKGANLKSVRISLNYQTMNKHFFMEDEYKGCRFAINNHLKDDEFLVSVGFKIKWLKKIPIPECCKSICREPDVKVEEELLYEWGPGNLAEKHPHDRDIPLYEDVEHQIRRRHLIRIYGR